MKSRSHKTKQFLILTAKLLIVGGAFYFIYDRLANNATLNWSLFSDIISKTGSRGLIGIILTLSFLNRFIEILKWQNLAGTITPVSTGRAAAQVLAALTAGTFTPNGIGEYAAKALYFKKEQAKNVVFLNLVCNGIQLIIAVVAGLAGLLFFNYRYEVLPPYVLLMILTALTVVIIVLITGRHFTVKGYSLHRLYEKINALPKKVHRKNALLALLRYMALVHQHYYIFLLFGVHLPYLEMITTIAAVYFLGSSLPTFQFLDVAVRGSVAVFFFGIVGVNEWIVVFAATLQWLLNIVIPVSLGSYFVFTYKSHRRPSGAIHSHPE